MRILVTGADGFIGSHLVEKLVEGNHHVRAFCFYNSFNSWGWLDTLSADKLKGIEVFTGDIRDPNGVRKSMENIDMVFHLAALIAIPFSYHSPDSYIDTNIKGTLNVLQAARENNVERILITSTSEVYGTAKYVPIDESHPRQPQSPYSASKIGADSLAESFYRSFDLPVTIVRPFNTYGPRQSARAIIPTIITQILAGNKAIKLGDLTPTRDLLFVEDTVEGFMAIAKAKELIGQDCNLATCSEVSIGELANQIIQIMDPAVTIETDQNRLRPQNSEVYRLFGENKKVQQYANWKPKHSLKSGLIKTINWFNEKGNLKGYKPDIYNI